ncbi:MAG: hypothetical protein ACE5G0_00885 [Rhodothermales bacterium]
MTIETLKSRWAAFAASKGGRRVLKGVRGLFLLGILGFLAYTLKDIDWRRVAAELPTNPLFYLLFLLLYFILPFAELLAYRITWTFDAWKSIPAFIKKRIYNKDVFQYSGEVFFFTWARKNVGLSNLELAKTIRDQNIVSSFSSTMVAFMMVVLFLYAGEKTVTDWVGEQGLSILLGAVVVVLVLTALGVRLRKYIFSMAWKTALLIFAVHVVRLVIGQTMQISIWAVAMPEVPLRVWFTYAALSIVITRIPFFPQTGLLFTSLSITMAGGMQVSEEAIAAMMLMIIGLSKALNLLFFAILSLTGRRSDVEIRAEEAEPPVAIREEQPVPQEVL